MDAKSWQSEFRVEVPMRLLTAGKGRKTGALAVLLHGMGQNGAVIESKLAASLGGLRHLLIPDGPLPFEKEEKGQRVIGRAWYLYTGDQAAFLASAQATATWLEREIDQVVEAEGLDPRQVHLVGYSQGGYLAGLMTLRNPARYRSLTTICSRLKHEILPAGRNGSSLPPILVLHGERDRFLPVERARESAEFLAQQGAEVDLRIFPSGHGLSPDQAQATAEFLNRLDESY